MIMLQILAITITGRKKRSRKIHKNICFLMRMPYGANLCGICCNGRNDAALHMLRADSKADTASLKPIIVVFSDCPVVSD